MQIYASYSRSYLGSEDPAPSSSRHWDQGLGHSADDARTAATRPFRCHHAAPFRSGGRMRSADTCL